MGYFRQILHVSNTIVTGMGITWRYFVRSFRRPAAQYRNTVQYPREKERLPERHRGIHYLETEKCIKCDICAKACPVDCISIEGTRDGPVEGAYQGSKVWITRFAIDYGKCIFCNLCCEPCPKDCIHMGQEFDFSCYNRGHLVKNLLADRVETSEDHEFYASARAEIAAVAAEKAKAKAAAAAAAAAAKKAAAAATAAPAGPAAPPATPAPPSPPPAPGKAS